MQVSLVLSERRLHEGQNHLFCDDKISGFRNWFIEVCLSVDPGRVTISRFSSDTEEQKQVLQETVIFCVLQIKWLAANDIPFTSSKTTCSISATSCWVLKSKGTPLIMDSLRFKAHKKLDGSTGLVEFFFTAMLRLIACNIGDRVFDSEGTLLQRLGTTLKICKMEFAYHVLLLLMKPTGRTDFVFDTDLLVCLGDDREDGELQVSFEGSLSLQLAAGFQCLLFLASQIQKGHSIEDLLNFLIVFLIQVLLKPSFLKQHKTDLPMIIYHFLIITRVTYFF